jgi:hypothetical protein
MESFPREAMMVISALPLLGLGILVVVLVSLGAKRDRWILPGVTMVILAVSSWGAAMEFGPRVKSWWERPPAMAPVDITSAASGEN